MSKDIIDPGELQKKLSGLGWDTINSSEMELFALGNQQK
jgi:hypothetical protein